MAQTIGTSPHCARRRVLATVFLIAVACVVLSFMGPGAASAKQDPTAGTDHSAIDKAWHEHISLPAIVVVVILLACSAFFSSCETAFLSIHKPRLRSLREEGTLTARWLVQFLDNPGRLLTTILVGNMIVNSIIGVVLGTRVKDLFEYGLGIPAAAAYATAIAVCTAVLLFFGEITPKVFAVRAQEAYARIAVVPLLAADRILAPIRDGLLRLTESLFQVTHFHELHAAPFITEEELKSVLADEQTKGVIEEDGRQMIRRILEFRDASLPEILIPRPDVVALPEEATVAEAHALFRQHEYSRMPVYREDLDHIAGILSSKDLIPSLSKGLLDQPIRTLLRPPHFVPETMSVQGFIKDVQRHRSHLAIVVDEYGGTEGIVTLHDAIEKVVGDIRDEDDVEQRPYEQIAERVYRVDGSMSLEELSDLIQAPIEDAEHNTVAGFLMAQTEKVPSVGDQIRYLNVLFTVEEVDGKRASSVRIEVPQKRTGDDALGEAP